MRTQRSTTCALQAASEATVKWNQRERERERERSACASLLASLLAGPCEDSREGFRTRTSRLWASWSLFETSEFAVLWWSPHRWRCCAWFWWCVALLCWQLLSHLCFWDQPSGQCFSRSCRHCFVAVDVGHPLCGLPWPCHLVVVVVLQLLTMFRFAFVVRSSRLRATQVSPVVVGAGLHAGQVLFPSAWCVLRHHLFVAVFVWESLEWQCCVAWNIRVAWSLGWRSCRSGHSSAPFLLWTLFLPVLVLSFFACGCRSISCSLVWLLFL